jgi:hypothetical protein
MQMADEKSRRSSDVPVVHGLDSALAAVAPEWHAAYVKAASLPYKGPVRDPAGVVHEIFGDFTACGESWAGQGRYGPLAHSGWTVPEGGEAYTCFACLRDIHLYRETDA